MANVLAPRTFQQLVVASHRPGVDQHGRVTDACYFGRKRRRPVLNVRTNEQGTVHALQRTRADIGPTDKKKWPDRVEGGLAVLSRDEGISDVRT
jgi:hypothetical protein